MNNILIQFGWKSQVKTALSSVANNFQYSDMFQDERTFCMNAVIGHGILIGCRHSV